MGSLSGPLNFDYKVVAYLVGIVVFIAVALAIYFDHSAVAATGSGLIQGFVNPISAFFNGIASAISGFFNFLSHALSNL